MHALPVSLGAVIQRILFAGDTSQVVLSALTTTLLKETEHETTAISWKKKGRHALLPRRSQQSEIFSKTVLLSYGLRQSLVFLV